MYLCIALYNGFGSNLIIVYPKLHIQIVAKISWILSEPEYAQEDAGKMHEIFVDYFKRMQPTRAIS
jgi:hypothetical protein